ncbi:hypothetical protein SNEBB_005441 [Seison nebaliae]|nr:hypothetical protein SNEBB_005441 [Seison nebaliae]
MQGIPSLMNKCGSGDYLPHFGEIPITNTSSDNDNKGNTNGNISNTPTQTTSSSSGSSSDSSSNTSNYPNCEEVIHCDRSSSTSSSAYSSSHSPIESTSKEDRNQVNIFGFEQGRARTPLTIPTTQTSSRTFIQPSNLSPDYNWSRDGCPLDRRFNETMTFADSDREEQKENKKNHRNEAELLSLLGSFTDDHSLNITTTDQKIGENEGKKNNFNGTTFDKEEKFFDEVIFQTVDCATCLKTVKMDETKMLICFHRICKKCGDIYDKINNPVFPTLSFNSPSTQQTCRHCLKLFGKGHVRISNDPLGSKKIKRSHSSLSSFDRPSYKCTSCSRKEDADKYCGTCEAFLCKDCHMAHLGMIHLREHKLISLDNVYKEELIKSKNYIFCERHPMEPATVFCENCNKFECSDCCVQDRKHHPYIGDNQKPLVEYLKEKKLMLEDNLYFFEKNLDDLIHHPNGRSNEIERMDNHLQLEKNMKEIFNQYRTLIDRVHGRCLQYLDKVASNIHNHLKYNLKLYDLVNENLNRYINHVTMYIGKMNLTDDDRCLETEMMNDCLQSEFLVVCRNLINGMMHMRDSIPLIGKNTFAEFSFSVQGFQRCIEEYGGELTFMENSTYTFNELKPFMCYKYNKLEFGDVSHLAQRIPANFRKTCEVNGFDRRFRPHFPLFKCSPYLPELDQRGRAILPTMNQTDIYTQSIVFNNIQNDKTILYEKNNCPNYNKNVLGMAYNNHLYNFVNNNNSNYTNSHNNFKLNNNPNMMNNNNFPINNNNNNSNNNLEEMIIGRNRIADNQYTTPTDPTPILPIMMNNARTRVQRRPTHVQQLKVVRKFGEYGTSLNAPHGFCYNDLQNHIVIADTNNHRILVFNTIGNLVNNFGKAGKEEGELWQPRKVAYIQMTKHYVVCDRGGERSRMQIFDENGRYVRRILVRYIDIVAGLAIAQENGDIVAVDSVSPTVFRIQENGKLSRWFDCSDHMKEPSDLAVKRDLYYICDFKGHSVAVFNYEGAFMYKIGSENITNFPNGIMVTADDDVLVADSHGNRLHIALFQNGQTHYADYDCPNEKVSRCCGLKMTNDGQIVTLAKNNNHILILDKVDKRSPPSTTNTQIFNSWERNDPNPNNLYF